MFELWQALLNDALQSKPTVSESSIMIFLGIAYYDGVTKLVDIRFTSLISEYS